MGYDVQTLGTSSEHAAAHGLGATVKHWWQAYWLHRAERVTVLMLRSLDDRTLHDIGMHRSEIGSLVYGLPKERRHTFTARS